MNTYKMAEILKIEKDKLIELLPEQFQEKFRQNSYIAGGAIYCLRNDKEVKDFDFFVESKEFADELMTYFKSLFNRELRQTLKGKYRGLDLIITKYAISIGKYQVITKYYGKPKDVVSEFDFKHNMFWFKDNDIICHSTSSWEYIDDNKLYFNENRPRDISGILLRIPKFIERGMEIDKREVAKIIKKLKDNGFDSRECEILDNYTTY